MISLWMDGRPGGLSLFIQKTQNFTKVGQGGWSAVCKRPGKGACGTLFGL